MEDIDYLYRYTSIDNLALTLKNHTIRLNPLDKMDDLQEQKTRDVENIGKFVFISSWTSEEKEDIPMWKMYTNPKSGVRIKLPKNPFVRQKTYASDFALLGLSVDNPSGQPVDTFLNIAELIKNYVYSVQAFSGDILKKVVYTDDKNLLEPNIRKIENGKINLNIGALEIYKNTYWEFQKEWRYIMTFINMPFNASSMQEMEMQASLSVNRLSAGIEPPPFRHFDLPISDEFFRNMEITPSPQMTSGARIALDALVEKYNPTATIKESSLLGLI